MSDSLNESMAQQPTDAQRRVVENCHFVGRRDPDSILQCNTFLRTFVGKASKPIHWCVDPGSELDYPVVRENLLRHVGELSALSLFSLNHQDPDVVGNLRFLVQENHHLTGIVSEDVWRLVRHLNVSPRKLYFTSKVKENVLKLPDGHRIQIVPTPFCHFRGAMAHYDLETRILFTGDLFAGFNRPGRVQLWGGEEDWLGIAQWHQIYMPSRSAVEFAIRQVRSLSPPAEIIAPQHGFLLRGDFLHSVLERLEATPMGLDLIPFELDERYLDGYRDVLHELLHEAAMHLSRNEVLSILHGLSPEHELMRYLRIDKANVELLACGIRAIPLVLEELSKAQFPAFRSRLKDLVLRRCGELKLPIPQVGAGVEEGGGWVGMQSLSLGPSDE